MKMIFALLVVFCGTAAAHEIGVSRSTWSAEPTRTDIARAELAFARGELLALAPEADADRNGALAEAELPAARPVVESLLAALSVRQGDALCVGGLQSLALAESDGLLAVGAFTCPGRVEALTLRFDLLDRLSPGHRHLVTTPEAGSFQWLHGRERAATVHLGTPPNPAGAPAAPFDLGAVFGLGVEHILTGFDHLVFLLGLMLVGGRGRALLGIVTAFTVAHSLTLGAAATGLLTPPPALVEAAIAGSILYVGLENLLDREPRYRWRLTFVFGLVHGFGFAGALAEVGLKDHLVPTLLGFNLGVEAGQLAVLAVALPLLMWARRSEGFRLHGVRLASLAVALAGGVWLVERVA